MNPGKVGGVRRETLTVYAIHKEVGGRLITSFEQVVDPEELKRQGQEVQEYEAPGGSDFDARLYVQVNRPEPPAWARFLEAVEGIELPFGLSVGGLLVIRLRWGGEQGGESDRRYFALTFGRTGERLLRDDAYVRGYGLRVALNVLCEDQRDADVRFQQFSTRRVTEYVLHAKRQTNRPAPFHVFGLDPQQDLLNGVVGSPADRKRWGNRIKGTDSITVTRPVDLGGVGRLCADVRLLSGREDYKRWFDWIDDVRPVTDPENRGDLTAVLTRALRTDPGDLLLTPPEVLEWDRVERFRLVAGRHRAEDAELRLGDYLGLLERTGQRGQLDLTMLKRHKVEALDAHGEPAYSWPVLRCLDGQIRTGRGDDQRVEFITNGRFYEVALTFLRRLDEELGLLIPESTIPFPAYQPGQHEDAYSEAAAGVLGMLLMDKQTVSMGGTDKVEVCDLLAEEAGYLIHVKRMEAGFRSSELSHLFSQGTSAAELLVQDPAFRGLAHSKTREVEARVAGTPGSATAAGRFSYVFSEDFTGHGREVVFAIIAPWAGRNLVEGLPFFSKLNLRERAARIRSLGYRVAYAPIESRPVAGRQRTV